MKLRDKLIELNIDVPDPIAPAGNYVPYKLLNGFIYISGQVPVVGSITSGNIITGRVPSEVSVSEAKEAAKICIINTMSLLIEATDNTDYDKIGCISVSGFVNSDKELTEHPEIINGASDMLYKIFGEHGKHTRIAVGSSSLPKNAAVEISSIFYIK